MRIRTAADLGAFIRERHVKLGMDQRELAEKAGTSRKWIVEVEQGKSRAEIGLVLRTLKTLGVSLDIAVDPTQKASTTSKSGKADINKILDSLRSGHDKSTHCPAGRQGSRNGPLQTIPPVIHLHRDVEE